jgi:hypothetical protein
MRLAMFAVMTCLLAGPAFADDTKSGNVMLAPCKAVATRDDAHTDTPWEGYCLGIVEALMWANPDYRVCRPPAVPVGQGVRVVVRYLDQHPERLHLNFKDLAVEAFREAWPCKQ